MSWPRHRPQYLVLTLWLWQIIKLHIGTWHAGPLFAHAPFIDFVNLELADTNQTDHHTHFFKKQDGIVFDIVDDLGARGSDEAGEKV